MTNYSHAVIQVKALASDQLERHIEAIMNGGADHVSEINKTPVEKWIEIAIRELEDRRKEPNWWKRTKQPRKRRI